MTIHHDGSVAGSGPPERRDAHAPAVPKSDSEIVVTWKEWQERQLAAFVFAVGVRDGADALDMARLDAARVTARRALSVASSLTYPYDVDTVDEIGRMVIGESKGLSDYTMNIGSHVITLFNAKHSFDAPRFAQWLSLWATREAGFGDPKSAAASSRWPELFARGLELAGAPAGRGPNKRK